MDNRQRYGYDREDRDDFRNENWRDRERNQGREFSMQNRYGSQDDWNTDRGREDYIRRGSSGSQNQGDYDYGQGSRQVYRTGGDRGYDREQNYQGNRQYNQSNRDWDDRNLPENYRSAGRDRGDFFNATPNWSNQPNFNDPYRRYSGQESQNRERNWGIDYNRNQSNWNDRFNSSENYGSNRGTYGPSYQSRQSNRGTEGYGQDYGFGGDFGYGAGSYDRYDRDRNYGQQRDFGSEQNRWGNEQNRWSGEQNRGRDESLTQRVGNFFGMGPKGYKRSDDRIREDVSERLADHPDIDASGIELQVKDGEVTLTGTVNDRRSKRLAEDVAEQARGVKDVHNQIRVSAGATETATSGTTAPTGSEAGRKSPTGTTGTDKTRAA